MCMFGSYWTLILLCGIKVTPESLEGLIMYNVQPTPLLVTWALTNRKWRTGSGDRDDRMGLRLVSFIFYFFSYKHLFLSKYSYYQPISIVNDQNYTEPAIFGHKRSHSKSPVTTSNHPFLIVFATILLALGLVFECFQSSAHIFVKIQPLISNFNCFQPDSHRTGHFWSQALVFIKIQPIPTNNLNCCWLGLHRTGCFLPQALIFV